MGKLHTYEYLYAYLWVNCIPKKALICARKNWIFKFTYMKNHACHWKALKIAYKRHLNETSISHQKSLKSVLEVQKTSIVGDFCLKNKHNWEL